MATITGCGPNPKMISLGFPQIADTQPVDSETALEGVLDYNNSCFGGKAGIEAFTELQWLTLQITSRQYPF